MYNRIIYIHLWTNENINKLLIRAVTVRNLTNYSVHAKFGNITFVCDLETTLDQLQFRWRTISRRRYK